MEKGGSQNEIRMKGRKEEMMTGRMTAVEKNRRSDCTGRARSDSEGRWIERERKRGRDGEMREGQRGRRRDIALKQDNKRGREKEEWNSKARQGSFLREELFKERETKKFQVKERREPIKVWK